MQRTAFACTENVGWHLSTLTIHCTIGNYNSFIVYNIWNEVNGKLGRSNHVAFKQFDQVFNEASACISYNATLVNVFSLLANGRFNLILHIIKAFMHIHPFVTCILCSTLCVYAILFLSFSSMLFCTCNCPSFFGICIHFTYCENLNSQNPFVVYNAGEAIK